MLSSTIARRVQDGPWDRSAFGVISLFGPPQTIVQRLAAAVLYGGPGAVLSGAAAARLHGLERLPSMPPGTALVLVEHRRHRVSRPPITVERTTRLPEVDDVRALLAEAVQRGFTRREPCATSSRTAHSGGRPTCAR